jgi:hypothetical protein
MIGFLYIDLTSSVVNGHIDLVVNMMPDGLKETQYCSTTGNQMIIEDEK